MYFVKLSEIPTTDKVFSSLILGKFDVTTIENFKTQITNRVFIPVSVTESGKADLFQ